MVDGVDPPQEVGEQVPVADVALVEVDLRAQVRGWPSRCTGGVSASSTTTSCPSASRRSQVWEPMNPAPPVTRILIVSPVLPPLGGFAVNVEGGRGGRPPGELAGPL